VGGGKGMEASSGDCWLVDGNCGVEKITGPMPM